MTRPEAERMVRLAYQGEDGACHLAVDIIELIEEADAMSEGLSMLSDEGVLRLAAKITEQRLEACFQARRQALTVIQGGQA